MKGVEKFNIKHHILQYQGSFPHTSQSLAQAANGVVKFSHLDKKRSRKDIQAEAGAEESEEEDDDKDAECAQGVQDWYQTKSVIIFWLPYRGCATESTESILVFDAIGHPNISHTNI